MHQALTLDSVMQALRGMSAEDVDALLKDADKVVGDKVWVPNPGPQTAAYYCEADELFYGGEAGGGKSALLNGLALTEHERSLLLRRTNKEASKFPDEIEQILGNRDGLNGQDGVWKWKGKTIDFGGVQHEEDKQKRKGDPHDLIGFDEVTDFTETQYTFIIAWNRSTKIGQRCRVIATGNPPTTAEGLWVIQRWAAWLDPEHPNPAQEGELRWYTTDEDGREIEVDGRGPHMIGGSLVLARSRTFIRARLSDNPDLERSGYKAVLDALPAELRAAYRDGKFDKGIIDNPWQTIPTDWIRAAQLRWKPQPPVGVPQCAIGTDVAQGGRDRLVLAVRHDGWYDKLRETPGVEVPDGKVAAGKVITARRDNSRVIVDIGGGWGGDCFAHLRENGIDAVSYMGVKKSHARTADRTLAITNIRSLAYWRFREALDPSQEGGSPIALPPDPELVADLTAPSYKVTPNGIAVESKEDVVKRLGRSTDKGDAVVMAWVDGLKNLNVQGGIKNHRRSRAPQVNTKKPK